SAWWTASHPSVIAEPVHQAFKRAPRSSSVAAVLAIFRLSATASWIAFCSPSALPSAAPSTAWSLLVSSSTRLSTSACQMPCLLPTSASVRRREEVDDDTSAGGDRRPIWFVFRSSRDCDARRRDETFEHDWGICFNRLTRERRWSYFESHAWRDSGGAGP